MIPILYEAHETVFDKNGLGGLSDMIKCEITEERNGIFELEAQYPIDGIHFKEITVDRIIKAKPSLLQSLQCFRIYSISKPINGIVTINAEHVSYQGNFIPILPPISERNSQSALSEILKNQAVDSLFSVTSDISSTTAKGFALDTLKSLKACLVGSDGSFVDIYGGELKFDNFNISIYKSRGNDNGVRIAYGKNLTDLKQEESMEDVVTAVATYWKGDDEVVTLKDKIYKLPNAQKYAFERVSAVDISSEFEDEEMTATTKGGSRKPTQAELLKKTQELYKSRGNELSSLKVDLTINFVDLSKALEEETSGNLERVELCDTVTVEFKKLGVNTKAKVVKTVFDALNEKYISVDISSDGAHNRNSVSRTIASQQQEINTSNTMWQEAIIKATRLITGNNGGCIVLDPPNNPQQLLIMDKPKKEEATKCWRWNLSGLGFSANGYAGPYNKIAITMDGEINGEMIKAGTIKTGSIEGDFLSADDIKSDSLTIKNGDNEVRIWSNAMTLINNSSDYSRTGFQNNGIFLGKKPDSNNIEIWNDGSAEYKGAVKVKDLSVNDKIVLYDDGNILCEYKGETLMIPGEIKALKQRVEALENK